MRKNFIQILSRTSFQSELRRVQKETGAMRKEIASVETSVGQNELCISELQTRLRQLEIEVLAKREQLADTK